MHVKKIASKSKKNICIWEYYPVYQNGCLVVQFDRRPTQLEQECGTIR